MANARDALWASGHDESVEVNQRALIDKVLARYSGEFTVFRELLQNSDDAGAKSVEIHFQTKQFLDRDDTTPDTSVINTKPVLPDLKTAHVHQWIFKNNGIPFRDEDWSRLKKIAEGNPDEEKIGAFGVGFYSLFSVTEEPFVTSGGQWTRFYWKDGKDQLFVRRGKLPDSVTDPTNIWTTFEMNLRESAPIPGAFDFTRFLASSITFMTHLSEVSVFFDDRRLSHLTKNSGNPHSVSIPRGLKTSSPKGMMQVKGMQTTSLSIKAGVMQWVYTAGSERPPPQPEKQPAEGTATTTGFFSSLFAWGSRVPSRTPTPHPPPISVPDSVDLLAISESSVVLTIFAADVLVKLDSKMNAELHRSTKKNPPTRMKVQLIYTGKDEYDASKKEDENQPATTGSVFQGMRADLDGTGSARIFIGHATGQTTGIGGHIAARFIPTVERESIDLVDRNVAVWNKELLYVAGFLSRSAYELEMDDIRALWNNASKTIAGGNHSAVPDPELRIRLTSRALHALKFFTFYPSTPSSLVSTEMQEAFFTCVNDSVFSMISTPHQFPMISTVGVRGGSDVRVPDPAFDFLKSLPIVPPEVLDGAQMMMTILRVRGIVRNITFLDVLQELRARPLDEKDMIACIKWWTSIYRQDTNPKLDQIRVELLNAAVLSTGTPGAADERIIPLSTIQTFLNTRGTPYIPSDGPLPTHLLPVSISKELDPQLLASAFPWKELTIIQWLSHITDINVASTDDTYNIFLSEQWAERVFGVLNRAWPSLKATVQVEIAEILSGKACIPTSHGMKTPQEAYLPNVHVFPDLPIVKISSSQGNKNRLETVLQSVGVRKHVDLQIVFNRMIKTGDWSIADLIKYLVAVQSTLTSAEIERLQLTAVFPKEHTSNHAVTQQTKVARYKASDLYEPTDVFRELGLPIIDWGTHVKWRNTSEEAKFLYRLGLHRFPTLPVVIHLASSADVKIRTAAFKYLLDNMGNKEWDYDPSKFSQEAFIPALKDTVECMASPSQVYANPSWATLGFMTVHPRVNSEAVVKLKIPEHPPVSALVALLQKAPPHDESVAARWFAVLASRVSAFSASELGILSNSHFVPVKVVPTEKGGSSIQMLPPTGCYFTSESGPQFRSKLFHFVDFGPQAKVFLVACGTRDEPSVEDIARLLVKDSRAFYQLAGGRENYLLELRNIALNNRSISPGMIVKMRRAPVLLGSRRVAKKSAEKAQQMSVEYAEDDWDLVDDLLPPAGIVVADDINAYQLFGEHIYVAPQDDIQLEDFYIQLGCPRLSSLIREEYETGAEVRSDSAQRMRALILERLPLFLHEHTQARMRVSHAWLSEEHNFVVKTFVSLAVRKHLTFGTAKVVRVEKAAGVALRERNGPIQLWLERGDSTDMYYDVSIAMCRVLFEAPKANDALLLMTILSADLRALQRRGYNVDRILRQQRSERQAADARRAAAIPLNPPPPNVSTEMQEKNDETQAVAVRPRPVSTIKQSLGNWTKRFSPTTRMPESPERTVSPSGSTAENAVAGPVAGASGASTLAPSSLGSRSRPQTPSAAVTPRAVIADNIALAIGRCRGETSNTVQGAEDVRRIKESLDEGYCDVTGSRIELKLAGDMGGYKIFVTDGSDGRALMVQKHDVLARFIHIVRGLREVYGLPTISLHIFHDTGGDLIAFNRNASLFLNVRYFESWHDEAVSHGDLTGAYTSWYFTLAHEIAHNLVKPHNSEHEFYFSSICEQYVVKLGQLLSGA